MSIFICYEKCTTCKKAQRWLDEHSVSYDLRPIKEHNPTEAELRAWHKVSGLPLKKFFNTSGQLYRSMELSKKLPDMSEDEQFALLATDGMLVKRPLFVDGDTVLVGFKEADWAEKLEK
jgi:arsenate reductase